MRKLSKAVLAAMLLAFVAINVQAQDFSDEDIKDYAVILMAQKSITDKINPYINSLIDQQEGFDGNMYNELNAIAKGDATKLPSSTEAEKFQQTFYATLMKRKKDREKGAGTVVRTLAKYSLGAKKYNAIKKAYKSGGDVKAKVDGLMASMTA
ncbi:MAG: hypothetical protein HEP71_26190 [Roseivirga sp.]|nr:hypothetical protein [Roseivirga sp.]